MESNQSLFSLSIDPVTKEHLSETAKWARFLAILGMISLVLLLILMAFSAFQMNSTLSSLEDMDPDATTTGPSEFMGVFMAIYSIVIAVIWFFPLLYLLRFATRMRSALSGNDQQALNESFQNLKRTMRYVGIVTIIGMALMLLGIVMAIVGMTMAS